MSIDPGDGMIQMSGIGDEEKRIVVTLADTLKEKRGDGTMMEEENRVDITVIHMNDADHIQTIGDEQGQEMILLFVVKGRIGG